MAKSDNSIDVSNFEIKDIPTKAMIFVEVKPEEEKALLDWYTSIQEGDVLTFRYRFASGQETVTHRVIGKVEKKNAQGELIGYTFTLMGDNKASEDANLMEQIIDTTDTESFNYIIGKVRGQNYFLGLLVYALKSTVGIICIIIIPCLIIIGFEVAKIIAVLNEDKKQKQAEESAQQASELEDLKRQLAMLQQSLGAGTGGATPAPAPETTPTPVEISAETPVAPVETTLTPVEENAVQAEEIKSETAKADDEE